jgi:transcriptional regulator with XRE-family HTH domain
MQLGKCQNPVHAASIICTVPTVGTSSRFEGYDVELLRKDEAAVAKVHSPAVRRRELGTLLRGLRLENALTVEQVAASLLCSPSKVSRIETGRGSATLRDIRDLCDLYGVTDQAERDRLVQLVREGRQSAWWETYDLTYSKYVGLEAEAISIHGFQSSVVPGLLQTPDYARALMDADTPNPGGEVIEQRIEARLIRQQLLTRESPPRFWHVMDEAALHRLVGGSAVMHSQLDQLIDACEMPHVTIQVIPFAAGAHPALESNFKILELPPPSPGVVYIEGLAGSFYLERNEELVSFREVFDRLRSMALDPDDTIDLIAKIRDAMVATPAGRDKPA